jgi:hypothetical protein
VSDEKLPPGFVSLKTVRHGRPDAAAALAEIRQIYFRTSRQTIDHDFAHAIELLKALPDDESRSKAHVYMEGLAEMRNEWGEKHRAQGTGQKAQGTGQTLESTSKRGQGKGREGNVEGPRARVEPRPPPKGGRGRS